MTKDFREELETQIRDIKLNGLPDIQINDGIAVRLYNPERMTSLILEDEELVHKVGYRIWMSNEFEVLSESQVEELKSYWS